MVSIVSHSHLHVYQGQSVTHDFNCDVMVSVTLVDERMTIY